MADSPDPRHVGDLRQLRVLRHAPNRLAQILQPAAFALSFHAFGSRNDCSVRMLRNLRSSRPMPQVAESAWSGAATT
jgi:hypothetical protein